MTMTAVPIGENELLPSGFAMADRTSADAQRRQFRWIRGTAVTAVAAAACSVGDWGPPGLSLTALTAALLFGLQLFLILGTSMSGDDRAWYDARAGAESIKTLAWRFGVGAEPFPNHLDEEEALRTFGERQRQIVTELGETLKPVVPTAAAPLPEALLGLRRSKLDERKHTYVELRLKGQLSWYQRKARMHSRKAQNYFRGMIAFSVLGVVGGVVHAVTTWGMGFDVAGICGAAVGGLLAASQAGQHRVTARAYTVTAHEIAFLMTQRIPDSESAWARWAESAEEALSREHTMWLASHGRGV